MLAQLARPWADLLRSLERKVQRGVVHTRAGAFARSGRIQGWAYEAYFVVHNFPREILGEMLRDDRVVEVSAFQVVGQAFTIDAALESFEVAACLK